MGACSQVPPSEGSGSVVLVQTQPEFPLLPTRTGSDQDWAGSFVCWLLLLAAALLFSFVYLSPRLVDYGILNHQVYCQKLELLELERQIEEMGKISRAIETDPDFQKSLAKSYFGTEEQNSERRWKVPDELTFDVREYARLPVLENPPLPISYRWLAWFRAQDFLRWALLGTSATMTLVSFVWDLPKS